ncbi:unnamed protein product [Rodentolepis nana]|uniref:C2H2-type domain-containing protein n=1 Tax=Rodentolepis nana TaxID=102285 RepID=A0A0R3T821_RODNA|nr:unnamed protein product [Rodentolepis nana]
MLGFNSSKIGSKIRWVDPANLDDIKPELEIAGARLHDVAKADMENEVGYGSEVEHILRPDTDGYAVANNGQTGEKKENGSPILKSSPEDSQTLPRRGRGRPKKQKRAIYLHDRIEKVESWIPSDDDSGVHNYMCPNCGKGYYYYMKLHSHMRRVHNCELPPSRRQCQVRGANRQPIHRSPSTDLHEHQEVHEQGLELRDADFRCPVCRQIFLVDFLPGHMRDSHKHFPPELCYFCDTSFPSAELTQQHIEFNHLKPALYTCHECSKMFSDLPEFRDHMLQIHQSDTTYKCDHCDRVFAWKKYLRQHIRQEHPSGGAVFSMRNNFHSERTSLTTACDKQQQGLLDEIAVRPEDSKQQQKEEEEEPKDPSIAAKQESSTSNGDTDSASLQL